MVNRVWIPAAAALALLLSACSDTEEDPVVTPDDNAEVTEDQTVREEEAPEAAENAADMDTPEQVEDDIEARQAAEELDRAEALREEGSSDNGEAPATDTATAVEAEEDTLAADPDDVLDEESAMPGEATRSDVDEMIAETERRFEEAEQRLEEQFQEVEQQAPVLEPMESEDFSSSWDEESSLPESTPLQDDREATDVEALIEDTERRFEEAQQRLEEQFKELESREADTGPAIDADSSERSELGGRDDSESDSVDSAR